MKALALMVILAVCLAGCGDTTLVTKDGKPIRTVTVVQKTTKIIERKHRDPKMYCSTGDPHYARSDENNSGNICYIKDGDVLCVAVLPDGGKSPRYKPDYSKCTHQGKK